MNIFKTFEIFLREPLSILKNRIVQIVNINTGMPVKPEVNVDLMNQKVQITVLNSEKIYNLLKTVQYRQQEKAAERLALPQKRETVVIGKLFGRTYETT